MNLSQLWSDYLKGPSSLHGIGIGPLSIWLREREEDLLLRISRDPPREKEGLRLLREPPPEGKDWLRIGSWDQLPHLKLSPRFPDRPVVVRPEFAYTIQPAERIQFYVGVPVSVELGFEEGSPLITEPVTHLSNTWFGLPTEGELCYAMRTLARRKGDSLDFGPWRVVCPVRVRNQSKEKISFERLCLRVQYLSIYEDDSRGMWATESSVIIRGGESWSRVAYARGAPAELLKPKLVVKGAENAQGTFLLRALTHGKGFFQ